jgi:hypothetical protein
MPLPHAEPLTQLPANGIRLLQPAASSKHLLLLNEAYAPKGLALVHALLTLQHTISLSLLSPSPSLPASLPPSLPPSPLSHDLGLGLNLSSRFSSKVIRV